jgi:hypothetical protein
MSAVAGVVRGADPSRGRLALVTTEPEEEGRTFFVVLGALVTVALLTLVVAVSTLVAAVLAA